jgi:hydrogenase maturation protease
VSIVPRVSIVGIGSGLGDDAAGWRVIAGLERALAVPVARGEVALAACRHPAVDLLDRLRGADRGILVDAVIADFTPGTVLPLSGDEVFCAPVALSTHGIDLPGMLRLGASLGELPGRLSLYGIVAEHVDPDRRMSAAVRAAVQRVVERIRVEICHKE